MFTGLGQSWHTYYLRLPIPSKLQIMFLCSATTWNFQKFPNFSRFVATLHLREELGRMPLCQLWRMLTFDFIIWKPIIGWFRRKYGGFHKNEAMDERMKWKNDKNTTTFPQSNRHTSNSEKRIWTKMNFLSFVISYHSSILFILERRKWR